MRNLRFTIIIGLIYASAFFARHGVPPTDEPFPPQLPFNFCTSGRLMWLDRQILGPVVWARFVPMNMFQLVLDIALLAVLEDAFWSMDGKLNFLLWTVATYVLFMWGYLWAGWGLLRGTGWFAPTFYFPSVYFSCSSGLTPLLLLCTPWIVQATDRPFITWFLLLGDSLVAGLTKETFWISIIALVCGWLGAVGLLLAALPSSTIYSFVKHRILRLKSTAAAHDTHSEDTYKDKPVNLLPIGSLGGASNSHTTSNLHPRNNQLAVLVICAALMSFGFVYSREAFYRTDACWTEPLPVVMNTSLPASRSPWFVVALPTVPRYGSERYLINTIDALLMQLPESSGSPMGSLHMNLKIVVVSHPRWEPEGHPVLEAAQNLFSASRDGKHYVSFTRVEQYDWVAPYGYDTEVINKTVYNNEDVRIHYDVASTIFEAYKQFPQAEWFLIQEDDFEVCPGGVADMFSVMCESRRRGQDLCGVFLTTGGSGIVIRQSMVNIIIRLLLDEIINASKHQGYEHSDVTMQQCLKGHLPQCAHCSHSLVVPSRCLFKHIGLHSARTGFTYPVKYTCEWRHPFAGNHHNVTTVLTRW